jgi:YHS domain-containing protein
MKILVRSLTAALFAATIAGTGIGTAVASEQPTLSANQTGRAGGPTILAENGTKTKKQIKVMLKGYDPVAYFKQGKAVRGNAAIHTTYNGVTYFFASTTDKKEFDKSPSKYEPQYGGYCANGVTRKERNPSDPNAFYVHQGKLYVCSNPTALKQFSSKVDVNIAKADKNWLQIGERTYNAETRDFDRPWPFGPEGGAQ